LPSGPPCAQTASPVITGTSVRSWPRTTVSLAVDGHDEIALAQPGGGRPRRRLDRQHIDGAGGDDLEPTPQTLIEGTRLPVEVRGQPCVRVLLKAIQDVPRLDDGPPR
jgi:hypothetical protein